MGKQRFAIVGNSRGLRRERRKKCDAHVRGGLLPTRVSSSSIRSRSSSGGGTLPTPFNPAAATAANSLVIHVRHPYRISIPGQRPGYSSSAEKIARGDGKLTIKGS